MADGVFNIAKGRAAGKVADDPTKLVVLLLKAAEAEADLEDHDDVAALLGAAGNTEADFANYARKSTPDTDGVVNVDDGNDRVDVDIPDQVWAAAGAGNNMAKLVVAYNQGAGDANLVPLTHHDFAVITDGSTITAEIPAAGFFRAE